jgi:hypothetical protein
MGGTSSNPYVDTLTLPYHEKAQLAKMKKEETLDECNGC